MVRFWQGAAGAVVDVETHTGHHMIRGDCNCVFKRADNALGTFYSVKGVDAAEVTK